MSVRVMWKRDLDHDQVSFGCKACRVRQASLSEGLFAEVEVEKEGRTEMGKKKKGSKGHAQGKKIGGRHTTVIPAAEKVVKFLREHRAVIKVILGEIKTVGNGSLRISVKDINVGLEVKVRSAKSLQTFTVRTKQSKFVTRELRRNFSVK